MSSGQSLRNGNSVEPGLPNTFRIPNARNRSSVACLTLTGLLVFVFSDDKARNSLCWDESHHVAVPLIVGCPAELAVHKSRPDETSAALTLNSLPSNSGCSPRRGAPRRGEIRPSTGN